MKKLISLLLVFCMIFSVAEMPSVLAAEEAGDPSDIVTDIIHRSDFDDEEIGVFPTNSGWETHGTNTSATYEIAVDPLDENNQAYNLTRTAITPGYSSFVSFDSALKKNTTVEFRFLTFPKEEGATGTSTLRLIFRDYASSSGTGSDLHSFFITGGKANNVTGYTPGEWATMRLELNLEAETPMVTTYINDEFLYEQAMSSKVKDTGVGAVCIEAPPNYDWALGTAYVDDFHIYRKYNIRTELETTADTITWDMIKGDNDTENVADTDLVLPDVLADIYSVEWESSSDVIGADGTVLPLASESTVTLTATITNTEKPDYSTQRTFTITVPAYEYELPGYLPLTYTDSATEALHTSDFEKETAGFFPTRSGWGIYGNTTNAAYQVAQDPVDGTNKAFELSRKATAQGYSSFVSFSPALTENTTVEFRFLTFPKEEGATGTSTLRLIFRDYANSSGTGSDLHSFYITGGKANNVASYTPGQWATMRLELNLEAETPMVTTYVDDELIYEQALRELVTETGVGAVCIEVPSGYDWALGTAYIDDFHVYKDYSDRLNALADLIELDVANPDEVTEESITLPTVIGEGNYAVEWSTANEAAITAQGIVTRRGFNQNTVLNSKVMLTEEIYINRQFPLTVLRESDADDARALSDYAEYALTFDKLTSQSANAVTERILLPTKGVDGITISWDSSNEDVIDGRGVVTRPDHITGDAEITLTATLRKGEASLPVPFEITVPALLDPADAIAEAKAYAEETVATYGIDVDKALSEEGADLSSDIKLLTAHENGTTINWVSSNPNALTAEGKVTRSSTVQTVTLEAQFDYMGTSEVYAYKINILPDESSMIELDIANIDINWTGLESDFRVPKTGGIYGSTLRWKTESTLLSFTELSEEYKVQVTRPDAESSVETDITVTVTATQGRTSKTVEIPASVVRLASSSELIDAAYDALTFDVIKGSNTAEDAIESDLVLPTGMDNGVEVSWSSDDESIINQYGEVFRPVPDSSSQGVILTAKIKRGEYAAPREKYFTLTVLPYTTAEDVNKKIIDTLGFTNLSQEAVDAVTTDLTLPVSWYYGSTVTWTSDNPAISISADGTAGVVQRPAYGSGDTTGLLTASISYNGEILTKKFSVTVKELNYEQGIEELWREDCQNWIEGAIEFTSAGTWMPPKTNGIVDGTYTVAADPVNPNNMVICQDIGRPDSPNGSGSLEYKHSDKYAGKILLGYKCYVEGNNGKVTVTARGPIGTASSMTLLPDGVISSGVHYPDNNHLLNFQYQDTYPQGRWFEIMYELDTYKRRSHIYVDGVCITEDGKVTYQNSDGDWVYYDSSNGIPYVYYEAEDPSIQGLNFDQWKNSSAVQDSNKVYFDDFYISRIVTYNEDQLAAAALYEQALLSSNNINALGANLVLPSISVYGVEISASSSNTSVLTDKGELKSTTEGQTVNWVVTFDNGNTVYRKVFPITVSKSNSSVTDAQAVELDAEEAKKYLEDNYLLSALENNVTFKTTGTYGSTITYSSSASSVITNAGVITRGSTNASAVITLTAERNGETAERTVNVTVLKKKTTQSTGDKVVSGKGSDSSGGSNPGYVTAGSTNYEDKVERTDRFSDVSQEHWAYDAVEYLAYKGIVSGNGSGAYEPGRSVNREEFVKMVVEMLGAKSDASAPDFTDVSPEAWYAEYISAGVENEIINGMGDGRFGVGQKISRQDIAVILFRAADLLAETNGETFSDDDMISSYAKDAVYTLRKHGIINGKDSENFAPLENATRAEAAAMIYRMIQSKLF